MRTTERGFTLLEVLAAIAILGILYTVLTDSAIEGLRSEKRSQRRLEASLLADRRLADLELQLGVGVVPPLGEEEETAEEDADFTVRVAVEPFDLILPELETGGAAPAPLLADLTTDRRSPLRVIRVTVAWLEAEVEQSVTRTTFGFDVNAIDPARLPQAPEAPTPPEGGGEQGQQQGQGQGQGQQQQQQQQQQQTPRRTQGESP